MARVWYHGEDGEWLVEATAALIAELPYVPVHSLGGMKFLAVSHLLVEQLGEEGRFELADYLMNAPAWVRDPRGRLVQNYVLDDRSEIPLAQVIENVIGKRERKQPITTEDVGWRPLLEEEIEWNTSLQAEVTPPPLAQGPSQTITSAVIEALTRWSDDDALYLQAGGILLTLLREQFGLQCFEGRVQATDDGALIKIEMSDGSLLIEVKLNGESMQWDYHGEDGWTVHNWHLTEEGHSVSTRPPKPGEAKKLQELLVRVEFVCDSSFSG